MRLLSKNINRIAAFLLSTILGLNFSQAHAQQDTKSRPSKTHCVSEVSADWFERASRSEKFLAVMRETKARLDERKASGLSGKGIFKHLPRENIRGKIYSNPRIQKNCRKLPSSTGPAMRKMSQIDTGDADFGLPQLATTAVGDWQFYSVVDDIDLDDTTGPDIFDFGEYGEYEWGDYMYEAAWWEDEVISPVWAQYATTPTPPKPDLAQCQSQLTTCLTITRRLKSSALVVCGASAAGSIVVAAICAGTVEWLGDNAETECFGDYASCISNQRASLTNSNPSQAAARSWRKYSVQS